MSAWRPDTLLPGFEALDLPAADDYEGPVVATLTGVRDGQRVVIGTVETHPTP